jgi:hypothetical protein
VAHVRHGEGLGLAGRHRRDGIPRPRSAEGGLRAGALRRAVLAAPRTARSTSARSAATCTEFGEGPPVQRTCAAADRTGHAILHTLYGQSLKNNAEFFIEYFAIDLIMSEDGVHRRRGVEPRRRHHPPLPRQDGGAGHRRLWPRLFLGDLGPHLHRRRRRHGGARRACRCRTWSSCSSTRPASTAPAA